MTEHDPDNDDEAPRQDQPLTQEVIAELLRRSVESAHELRNDLTKLFTFPDPTTSLRRR